MKLLTCWNFKLEKARDHAILLFPSQLSPTTNRETSHRYETGNTVLGRP